MCDYLSPRWATFTGESIAALRDRGWLARLHPDDAPGFTESWRAAAENDESFAHVVRLRGRDGYRWFRVDVSPLRADGAWAGAFTDIDGTQAELYRARTRLAALAAHVASVQRLANVGSWTLEVGSGEVLWTDETFRIFGLPVAATAPPFEAMPALFRPASWEQLTAAVAHAIATGEGYELVVGLVWPDGQERIGVARGEAFRDKAGAIVRLGGTIQDVTARERAAESLARASERLELATSAAKVAVWDWHAADGRLFWDRSMFALYEADPARDPEQVWAEQLHKDDAVRTRGAINDAVMGVAPFDTTFRIVTPSGEKHLRAKGSVHRDAEGRPFRMVGANWDVTEQRVAELALRQSDALQRSILASAGSAIVATDLEGTITLFNRAAEELTGYSAAEVVGRATPAVFHDRAEVMERKAELERELGRPVAMLEVFTARATAGTDVREWTYRRKDGSAVLVLITLTRLASDDGGLFGFLGVVMNLEPHRRQERELRELNRLLAERTAQAESANEAKSRFLANMSHEIRTPLGAIMGITYLMSRTTLSDEQRGFMRDIERSAQALLGMINDVLDLSKIEAGQLALDLAAFRFTDVVEELRSLMSGFAVGKRIRLAIEVDPTIPGTLMGDRIRLMQVLTNLAGNAIKFTEQGVVRVIFSRLDDDPHRARVGIEVIDSGPGIDESQREKLFTRFLQADRSSTRRGGTGLGLAIVRELVTLMGGSVGVTSRPGRGSRFWVELPFGVASDARHAATRRDARPSAPRLAGVRVLVVDDSDLNRDVVGRILALEGAVVATAESGAAAIACTHVPDRFDVIIMDMQMPELDGAATVREIRRSSGHTRVPIIALTAGALASVREQATGAGMNDFISKPFEPARLVAAIERQLDARQDDARQREPADSADCVPANGWPEVDGIDACTAQERLMGDLEIFLLVLRQALDELDVYERGLSPELGASALGQRLHRLRGGAGSIGAIALFDRATALEHELTSGRAPPDTWPTKLAEVQVEVTRLRAGIARVVARP